MFIVNVLHTDIFIYITIIKYGLNQKYSSDDKYLNNNGYLNLEYK